MSKRIRPYVNVVGPGDYETPSIFGGSTNVASKRNSPSFTFAAGRDRTKAQFISKEFLMVKFFLLHQFHRTFLDQNPEMWLTVT